MKAPKSSRSRNRAPAADADASAFIGLWRKQPGEPCAAQYPAELELKGGGHYLGRSDPAGEYVVWDVGTWSLTGPGEIAISNAYDKVVGYRYEMAGSELRFTEPVRCSFGYARATGG